jgi:hypothetical protein
MTAANSNHARPFPVLIRGCEIRPGMMQEPAIQLFLRQREQRAIQLGGDTVSSTNEDRHQDCVESFKNRV